MGYKVITRILGGVGNQLFCYAAARRLALANDAELVVDDISGFVHDHGYQRQYQLEHFNIQCRKATPSERLEPFARARRLLKRRWNARLPFSERRYIQQEGMDYDPRLLLIKPRQTIYLEGYWQSEEYFKDVAATVHSDLQITPPTDALNLTTASRIRNCSSVAVHMRFFNALGESGVNNASPEYYLRALRKMDALAPNAHYFVFSDNPDNAVGRIPWLNGRVTYVSHNRGDENACADLWLMTQCRHFIIANSTFSWWGAWLASYPSKLVIAPGLTMREGTTWWGFNGLLPERWIKL